MGVTVGTLGKLLLEDSAVLEVEKEEEVDSICTEGSIIFVPVVFDTEEVLRIEVDPEIEVVDGFNDMLDDSVCVE